MYVSPKFRSGSHTQLNSARRFLNTIVPTGAPAVEGDSNPSHSRKRTRAFATMCRMSARMVGAVLTVWRVGEGFSRVAGTDGSRGSGRSGGWGGLEREGFSRVAGTGLGRVSRVGQVGRSVGARRLQPSGADRWVAWVG